MANNEDVKAVKGGFDFEEEWLQDLEEVFDFDLPSSDNASKSASVPQQTPSATEAPEIEAEQVPPAPPVVQPQAEQPEEEVSSLDLSGDDEILNPDDIPIEIEEEDFSELNNSSETLGRVTTQKLDVATLQKKLSARTHKQESNTQSRLTEEAQFITLILMRLFDDLELLVLQKRTEEVIDLAKQFNRLANIVSFCDMGSLLPMFAYITNLLPFSFSESEIGVMSARSFDALKLRHFLEKAVEILNCLMFLLRLLAKRYATFDTSRFADTLERLYQTFDALPAEPSLEAPLPMSDSRNPSELTTRTFTKIARTVDALATESLHYIESSSRYGCITGYVDAAKSLHNAVQVANEYKFADLSQTLTAIYEIVNRQPAPNAVRDAEISFSSKTRQLPSIIFRHYETLGDLIRQHFSSVISEKKLNHFRDLRTKLEYAQKEMSSSVKPLNVRWQSFVSAANVSFSIQNASEEEYRQQLPALREAAKKYEIQWLADVFAKFELLWESYPASCANALSYLGKDILSFPTMDIKEEDFEQLNHRRLKVLFARTPNTRSPQAYSVIKRASEYADTLSEQLENARTFNADTIEDILIDARNIRCISLVRACEVLLTLIEHLPADPAQPISDSLVQGIYFCGGLFEEVTHKLFKRVSKDSKAVTLQTNTVFFESILKLYQTEGRPRESVSYFIHQRLGDLIAELQLVWANTSTQTSTKYYSDLLVKLLHIADLCGLQDVRMTLAQHIDEIPPQDFINVNDETLMRQYRRVCAALREANLPEPLTSAGEQAQLFFTKIVSALNMILRLPKDAESALISSELEHLSLRVTALGLSTDFPPIIAILHELNSLSKLAAVSMENVETLLFWILNIAHNVCPNWKRPQQSELEFIKAPICMPTSVFQQQLEHARVLYDTLKTRSHEDPVLIEHAESLYRTMHTMTSYAPFGLDFVLQNARNRCRYLKKNIAITLDTNGYPSLDEADAETDDVITTAFVTVIELMVNLLIDYAFGSTDENSEIRIVLEPVTNSCSASISHNALRLTNAEIQDNFARVNLDPAPYDNVFEMLLGSKRLMANYPPVRTFAYIQPILKQFSGRLDISNVADHFTSFFITFAL